MQEDAGNYQQAEGFFNQATKLDPNFRDAGNKLQSSQSLGKSGGTKENLVSALRKAMPAVKNEMINLSASRLEQLGSGIIQNFVQGVDYRSPAQEVLGVNQELPSPPPPPPPPAGN
jgi:hypothetical protein